MHNLIAPKLAKWPFFVADALLLATAYGVTALSRAPMGLWELGLMALCVAGGAVLGVLPFALEYRGLVRLAEGENLTTVVVQIQKLEALAAQITDATGRWQMVQEVSEKTATTAKGIAERMGAELKAFTQFMERANDSEKAALRLEVEKLRRGEGDWLQVLVHMLDHTFALNQGALRSGQPKVIEQTGRFQSACLDIARRVGLAPFTAQPAEPFDPKRHTLLDGDGAPPADAVVSETLATGYTFQGRLLRPALVRLASTETPNTEPAELEATGESPS